MPELIYDSIDQVPEGLKDDAKKNDNGQFVVKVVAQAKLDEFRATNITVSKARDDLAAILGKVKPFIGEDPDAFVARLTELEGIATKVKDGSLKGSDAITTEVDNRVKAMRDDFQRQLSEQAQKAALAEGKSSDWEKRFHRTIVDRAVTDAVVNPASGALPDALEDILQRASNVFSVTNDNKIVAKDGEATRYGSDGATPMTPLEWLSDLRKKAPYLFKGSSGGGANGNGGDKFSSTLGLAPAEFAKLSPEARLSLVHKQNAAKRK